MRIGLLHVLIAAELVRAADLRCLADVGAIDLPSAVIRGLLRAVALPAHGRRVPRNAAIGVAAVRARCTTGTSGASPASTTSIDRFAGALLNASSLVLSSQMGAEVIGCPRVRQVDADALHDARIVLDELDAALEVLADHAVPNA